MSFFRNKNAELQRAPATRDAELQRAPATQHRNREILMNDRMSFFRKWKKIEKRWFFAWQNFSNI